MSLWELPLGQALSGFDLCAVEPQRAAAGGRSQRRLTSPGPCCALLSTALSSALVPSYDLSQSMRLHEDSSVFRVSRATGSPGCPHPWRNLGYMMGLSRKSQPRIWLHHQQRKELEATSPELRFAHVKWGRGCSSDRGTRCRLQSACP